MAKIPHKIQERIKAALRRFKPLLKAARERDAGRADTATLALDLLSELFGYDRYTEITSELDNKESVFDFSIQTEGQPRMLVRVSPIGMAPDDRYLLATAQYAQMNGVDWIIMTNGIAWQVHHVEDVGANAPETPVVLAFDLLQMQPGREAHLGTIHLLTREGHEKAGLSHFKLRLEMTNRHYLGAMVLSDAVVASVRRELQKLNPDLRVTPAELRENLAKGVLRPDIVQSNETRSLMVHLQKVKEAELEERRKAADPNRFASRKGPKKKAGATRWTAKPGAKRKAKASGKFSKTTNGDSVVRITQKDAIKKVLKRSEDAPAKPAGRGRLLHWGK
ncbi:MAG: hypothetical protein VYD86_02670 [Verrucomicrobiota bacterium]|nr:hypothetical protein [Verrucomicrobiota bacterium]